jgi:glucose-6-phosphate dehydrogenase assembly protein OpcA
MPAAVQPEKILRDLRELWEQLGHEQEAAGGVLRACAMTLLVVAEDQADAEQARRTIGVLMHGHPSRAIVLRMSQDEDLEARVFAECWMPFGSNQQICAEGVEVTAGTQHLIDVARLLVPIIVPDLPVVLWCRGAHAFVSDAFDPLFPLAGKIVFDSATASEPKAAIAALKGLKTGGRRVADLAWTRLTGWREALANAFDDGNLPPDVKSIRIAHGGTSPSASVLYFATWIGQMVPSAAVTFEPAPGEPGLQSVTLSGGGSEIAIVRTEGSCVEIRGGAHDSRSLLPADSEEALMGEELSILGADPAFDRILA